MNLLVAHHAKDPQVCQWVIDNVDPNVNNVTVKAWVQACKEYLQSISDGPVMVSTGQRVTEWTARQE